MDAKPVCQGCPNDTGAGTCKAGITHYQRLYYAYEGECPRKGKVKARPDHEAGTHTQEEG